MSVYFCVVKSTLEVLSAGLLPEVWGTITGLTDQDPEALADMTWAGYPDHCFVQRARALEMGVTLAALDAALALGAEVQYVDVKEEIQERLAECDWVVVKASETGVAIPSSWTEYRQAVRDVQLQENFPFEIEWPNSPVRATWAESQTSTLRDACDAAVEKYMNDFAKTGGFRDMDRACSYSLSTDPVRKTKGDYCVAMRDQIWDTAQAILLAVSAGERPVPTVAQVLAELPELTWPAA